MSALNWQVNSFSNIAPFFTAIKYNYPVNCKLIHFLLLIKGPNKSPNFETSVCSGENLPNSSCHFPNHNSAFLQILHHSLVSWNIAPMYVFSSKIIHFGQKQSIKCKFLILSSAQVKIHQIPHVNFELTSQFLLNICIILHCYVI